ncbi:MAG: hypothetical protein U0805_05110 [Pirellulales bacterium]
MSDETKGERGKADDELEREIRADRKFTLEEAVARMIGPGAMKGESPITRMQQSATEIASWLRTHLSDSAGALEIVLNRRVKESDLLLAHFEEPLVALASYCQQVLDSDHLLEELVRDADFQWGRIMGERPYFEKMQSCPDPDDPYTIASVRATLLQLHQQLTACDDVGD